MKVSRSLMAALIVLAAVAGCNRESHDDDNDVFSFIVYPGAHYLGPLTELTKKAHAVLSPNDPTAPPTAIYDTDASVEDVGNFYARAYGYPGIAPDAGNDLSAAKPLAYYRVGDIAVDVQGIMPVLEKLNIKVTKDNAWGRYKAIEIAPKANRPRVTIQRPYFDVVENHLVDRTIILMSR